MMSALYKEEGASLRVEILQDPAALEFIDTHATILDSSFEETEMSDILRQRLKESDWMFSGMKTFHELNEAFPSLLDESGVRKPFEQFLKDVQSIDETYNRNYLRAEYNFAQGSAEMAARWEDFGEDEDDYYLQYRTAGDDNVRPEHAALNGVTLPMSDKFWKTYYPPNGWNCRCTVVQVLKEKHKATDPEEAMARGVEALAKDKKGMFNFNSGIEQRTFPAYNPYTISRCATCDKAKLNLAFIPDNQVCQTCQYVQKCYIGKEKVEAVGTGTIKISKLINPESSDYDKLHQIAEYFASQGAEVEMTPKMSRPANFVYDCYYQDLRGTKYEGKCPDLRINGVWYEHEGFITTKPKNALRNMLSDGLVQSNRLIIDRPELTERYMERSIYNHIREGADIKEIWLLNKDGSLDLLYKKTDG